MIQEFYSPVGEDYDAAPLPAPIQVDRPYVPPELPVAPTETRSPVAMPPVAPMQPAAALAPSAGPSRFGVGMAIVTVGLATGVGAYVGGAYGAGAGLLLSGAVRNTLRAKRLWTAPSPTDHSEAVKSGTMALFGLGIGGWLAYKAYESRRAE